MAAASLVGMLASEPSAAEQGWAPVVTTPTTTSSALHDPIPPKPPAKAAAKTKPPAVVAAPATVELPAAVPSNTSDIITGSIDATGTTRMLSPEDSARLFAGDGDPGDELITGAVNGQGSDLARGYCVNIAGAAADARLALQRAKLADVEKEIGKRIAALEAKTAEYKTWVERREDFMRRASAALVKIYSQMEPESAAGQLVAMDEETAASLLMKLEPPNASAILNEMPAEKAARLSGGIANATRAPKAPGAPAAAPPPPAPVPPRPRADASDGTDPNEDRS